MNQTPKKPIRNYSKCKQDSPEKSTIIATEEEAFEHRIIDSDGQVYIVLPTSEATIESDDNNSEIKKNSMPFSSPQLNGSSSGDFTSYRCRDHYTRMVINGEDRDVCNEDGCTQSFKSSTSTSHKKKHTMMHMKSKIPELIIKPELTAEDKIKHIAKLITSAHLPLSVVENEHFRLLTGLELSESFIRNKIADMHSHDGTCPFLH